MQIIYATVVGSYLYGINTKKSDIDFKAIYFPDVSEIYGMAVADTKDIKTDKDVEGVVYPLKKFFSLCTKANPTLLELLFIQKEDCILYKNDFADNLISFLKNNILSKKIYGPYRGYFNDQYKSLLKGDNSKIRNETLVQEYGYDVKKASHCFRIANQAIEILSTGTFNPTLSGKTLETCKNIRAGKIPYEKMIALLDEVQKTIDFAYNLSTLPDDIDREKIDDFLISTLSEYCNNHYNRETHKIEIHSKDLREILKVAAEKLVVDN